MGFITQAGIALGLAREVAVGFPALGDAFATLIIAVIVLNEILGPLALREGLRRMGESNLPEPGIRDNVRDVLILGAEGQALALARRLAAEGWRVRVADLPAEGAARPADIAVAPVAAISAEGLSGLLGASTDALVAMLADDQANLLACELAHERFGVPRLIVRLTTPALRERFEAVGALIVDPGSAMVNLLDQAVRAPQALSLLLHTDPAYDMVQLSVTNPEIDGTLVRDLRLPADVLLLELVRDGEMLMPHGYTRLRLGDEVTVVGRAADLSQVSLRLGY
jgi:Trk K+ transport system NAD-binding subunit